MRLEHPVAGDLVKRARDGDVGAFHGLFEQFHERVYRYATVRVRDQDQAQDVVQDVFLAVWQALPGFRYEHEGSFPGWLFGIARNVVGTHVRKASRHQVVPLEHAPVPSEEFEGAVVSRRLIEDELARLPEMQREVLVLRFLVGMPTRDVAGSIGRSEGAVTALQIRGLRRLRKQLEEA